MLASLLINNAYTGHTRKIPRNGIVNGRFIMYEGSTYDIQDKPERPIVERIAKVIARIDVPKEVKAEAAELSKQILFVGDRKTVEQRLADAKAYRRLVEILKTNVQETEDVAILLLLMEI